MSDDELYGINKKNNMNRIKNVLNVNHVPPSLKTLKNHNDKRRYRSLLYLQKSENYLRKAIDIRNSLIDAHYELGFIFYRTSRIIDSIGAFTNVLIIQPNDYKYSRNMLNILKIKLKQYKEKKQKKQINKDVATVTVTAAESHAAVTAAPPSADTDAAATSSASSTTAKNIKKIGLAWQLSYPTGWGIFGMNILGKLNGVYKSHNVNKNILHTLLLIKPHSSTYLNHNDKNNFRLKSIYPMHLKLLNVLKKQSEMYPNITLNHTSIYDANQNGDIPNKIINKIKYNFPIIHQVPGSFEKSINRNLLGTKNIGVCFFEREILNDDEIDNLKKYDLIIAGSSWNKQILLKYADKNNMPPVEFVMQVCY